ncbi:UNVERIFIED_CONTAM: hypothetical protein GTU68_059904, partial [Idotea baltica]|nr:hypothetical protein [Idotea baltica]
SGQIINNGISQAKESAIDLIAGGVGATVSVYVGQPLDTVKVKLQTFPSLYSGMIECFIKTFRKDGLRGLYAGTVPALTANIAENSILFAAYGLCQRGVSFLADVDNVKDLSSFQNASSGFFAAFFSSLALCPTELIKCRLQAMHELAATEGVRTKNTPYKLTRHILKTEGVAGLYRGFSSTVSREMPGYFVFFGSYEACRTLLTPPGKSKDDISPLETVFCGGLAGVALWTSVFPFDVTKSRIQVVGSKETMVTLLLHIKRTEGIRALYNGLTPTVLRSFPATGVLFLAYEWTKKFLHDQTKSL